MEGASSRNAPPPEMPVNDDLALAKALQEQERAFALLATSATAAGAAAAAAGTGAATTTTTTTTTTTATAAGGGQGQGQGEEEEELDDEALAWKLHEQMEREHLMALAGMLPGQEQQLADVVVDGAGEGRRGDDDDDDDDDDINDDEDVEGEQEEQEEEGEDPASLSYERLTALTDVVGVVPKKASDSALSKVVVGPYVPRSRRANGGGGGGGGGEKQKEDEEEKEKEEEEEEEEQCAVCRVELERGEEAATLPCEHSYHEGCIRQWLERAKSCPVCNAELE